MPLRRPLKYFGLWFRFFLAFPISVGKFATSARGKSFRFSVERASWGKRWFLGLSRPTAESVANLSFRSKEFETYAKELISAKKTGCTLALTRPPWCQCANLENHNRFMSLTQSDPTSFRILVTLDAHGRLAVVDGLRRLAVAISQGRKEVAVVVVVPVKMMRAVSPGRMGR